tara:strand:+ start:968 stop:1204 length:237 start_codon:yes stop_codon:yes gene_type:complete
VKEVSRLPKTIGITGDGESETTHPLPEDATSSHACNGQKGGQSESRGWATPEMDKEGTATPLEVSYGQSTHWIPFAHP